MKFISIGATGGSGTLILTLYMFNTVSRGAKRLYFNSLTLVGDILLFVA